MKKIVLLFVVSLCIVSCEKLLPSTNINEFDGNLNYKNSKTELVQKLSEQVKVPKEDIQVSWGASSSTTFSGMDYFINLAISNVNPEKLQDSECVKMVDDSFKIINKEVINFDEFKAVKVFIYNEVEENGIIKRNEYILSREI